MLFSTTVFIVDKVHFACCHARCMGAGGWLCSTCGPVADAVSDDHGIIQHARHELTTGPAAAEEEAADDRLWSLPAKYISVGDGLNPGVLLLLAISSLHISVPLVVAVGTVHATGKVRGLSDPPPFSLARCYLVGYVRTSFVLASSPCEQVTVNAASQTVNIKSVTDPAVGMLHGTPRVIDKLKAVQWSTLKVEDADMPSELDEIKSMKKVS